MNPDLNDARDPVGAVLDASPTDRSDRTRSTVTPAIAPKYTLEPIRPAACVRPVPVRQKGPGPSLRWVVMVRRTGGLAMAAALLSGCGGGGSDNTAGTGPMQPAATVAASGLQAATLQRCLHAVRDAAAGAADLGCLGGSHPGRTADGTDCGLQIDRNPLRFSFRYDGLSIRMAQGTAAYDSALKPVSNLQVAEPQPGRVAVQLSRYAAETASTETITLSTGTAVPAAAETLVEYRRTDPAGTVLWRCGLGSDAAE